MGNATRNRKKEGSFYYNGSGVIEAKNNNKIVKSKTTLINPKLESNNKLEKANTSKPVKILDVYSTNNKEAKNIINEISEKAKLITDKEAKKIGIFVFLIYFRKTKFYKKKRFSKEF